MIFEMTYVLIKWFMLFKNYIIQNFNDITCEKEAIKGYSAGNATRIFELLCT